MADAAKVPSFPTQGVAEKALELGFGSGPWSRSELTGRWTASSANKFINDAKEAGWLAAPFRDEFYILPARDLAVVGWLPPFERQEFVVGRMLAALGIRYWCLSAWARGRGLLFPQPLFVTDLADLPLPPSEKAPASSTEVLAPPPLARLAQASLRRTGSWRTLPFPENTILVPCVPQSLRSARFARAVLPVGAPGEPPVLAWDVPWYPGASPSPEDPEAGVRAIPYPLDPGVDDPVWVAALLFSLGLSRAEELVEAAVQEAVEKALEEAASEEPRVRRRASRKEQRLSPLARRFEQWAALLAPATENKAWRERLAQGPPYLLVPPSLASEAASSTRARRFEDMKQVGAWFDARA